MTMKYSIICGTASMEWLIPRGDTFVDPCGGYRKVTTDTIDHCSIGAIMGPEIVNYMVTKMSVSSSTDRDSTLYNHLLKEKGV